MAGFSQNDMVFQIRNLYQNAYCLKGRNIKIHFLEYLVFLHLYYILSREELLVSKTINSIIMEVGSQHKEDNDMKILNKWPDEAFKEIETNENSALIALTHDPKIDDPALQHALNKKFYYIGALGSKKTHENRCQRLKEAGFNTEQINSIHGPIGIKLGGRSAPEIALSIIAQLVSETYKK